MPRRFLFLAAAALALVSCSRETQVERANREGILILGNSGEPKSLDPQLVTGVIESKIINSLMEGLVADDPENDDGLPPGAAASWEHNDDLTEWTFHLRPEGRWSDGVPLTASDYVFSFHRMLHPDLIAPYVEMLYFIENAEAFNKGEISDFSKVGVWADDDLTLRFKLREPVPFLPSLTRHYTWFAVPRHVILQHGKMTDRFTDWSEPPNMVGNGPFRLKSWKFHDSIEVEKNPHYWGADQVALNGIRFLPIENPYTEARAFFSGQLHSSYTLPPDLIDSVRKKSPKYLRQEPYVGTVFVRLNTTRKGLDDPRVRRALGLAIDRAALTEYVLEGYFPATSLTPKMGQYEPDPVLRFDPEEARRLLAEAGYPDGKGFPRFSVLISRPAARASTEALQAMWREHLNIIVDIQNKDWGSYISAQQSLDFDIASAGWIGDYLDPTTFLNLWTQGNGNNNTGWSNPEFENLLDQAAHESDAAQRLEILRKAESVVMAEQPILPVAYYSRNYLLRPEVKGWHPLLLDNHPFKTLRLDP
ncbi:oligopeptide transport system substrate-binding protein [Haloferula luteola]|uniref:Oligopeptide transport system substrate-binding protein n=1 Tax=Haloferula luteola TaxID=595692 RepID=A0A840V5Y4_9BACT|nr:peptide ABC transporter substrate-binding protein [Haloferula luteola]MBB5350198.1 oligopeptide transport system substrate-binding protein [Haloferula luteola]